ncbi:glycoside hydrolase superfamily [Russula dissimulans]|nr:glycoside hydrolase superfamily [Russula dissimulans]
MLVHMYSLTLALALVSLLCLLSPASALPTRTTSRKSARWSSDFVTTSGDKFMLDGKEFRWVGTNAYWLPALNSEDDISDTLRNMSNIGIKVVRLWGHNDVTEIPTTGVYLALIKDGMVTINQGPNGFQRLDKVIELAKSFNIRVMLTFTNNWDIASGSSSLPRNFLSNDYGGMDTYVREFGVKKTHDEFYTDQTIRDKFYSYVEFVVKRYANEPGVLGWELANDARCESTLSTSPECNTNVVTQWHADTANFVGSMDPNHPIAAGTHGFFCPTCPKLFTKTPPPQPSPASGGSHKRTVGGFLTPKKFFQMITDGRRAAPRTSGAREGFKIRGRWTAPLSAKRQSGVVGPAFDGSHGVDSEDILNIPGIDFHSFQTFPDQNDYEALGSESQSPATDFDQTLQTTTDWINLQLNTAKTAGKPSVHTAFGLVTQGNVQQFIPFNSSTPLAQSQKYWKRQDPGDFSTGVSDQQVTNAYTSWGQTTFNGGGSGANEYQWSSQNIQSAPGTVVQDPSGDVTQSPNDGYGIAGSDGSAVQQVLNTQSQNIM